jgi:hypothetical protein
MRWNGWRQAITVLAVLVAVGCAGKKTIDMDDDAGETETSGTDVRGEVPSAPDEAAAEVGRETGEEDVGRPCKIPEDCDDGDPCTAEACNTATWTCRNVKLPGLCPECLEAGGEFEVVPDAPECCPGLVAIALAQVTGEGECELLDGAAVCAACGNGTCEADWENVCNCAEDCPLPPGECHGPLVSCPEGEYCQYPPGTCDLVGATGNCVSIPTGGCGEIYQPVCGCDGKTYANQCEMQVGQVSMDHEGECEEACLGLGGSFTDFETEGKCCPGLAAAQDCLLENGACTCPNCPCFICLPCGDGLCGPLEHACNCPDDCTP